MGQLVDSLECTGMLVGKHRNSGLVTGDDGFERDQRREVHSALSTRPEGESGWETLKPIVPSIHRTKFTFCAISKMFFYHILLI